MSLKFLNSLGFWRDTKDSQMVMKENPRKRPSDPPDYDKNVKLQANIFQKGKIFDSLKLCSDTTESQTVIKENPRKRPSDPPNSATRDCQG